MMSLRIRIRITFLMLALVIMCLLPLSVNAQSKQDRELMLCDQSDRRSTLINESFSKKLTKFNEQVNLAKSKVSSKRQEVERSIDASHQKFDNHYRDWLNAYKNEVPDKTKLSAAEKFYQELLDLITKRRNTYAVARQKFYQELDDVRDMRSNRAQEASKVFRQQSEEHLLALKVSCSKSDPDLQKLRLQFIEGLRTSRLEYGEFRRRQSNYKEAIAQVKSHYTDTIEGANKIFEHEIQEALSVFREVDPSI